MRAQVGRAVAALPARMTAAVLISLTAVVLALAVLASTASRSPLRDLGSGHGRPGSRSVPTQLVTTTAGPTRSARAAAGAGDGTAFTVLTLLFGVGLTLVALSFIAILAAVGYRLMLGAFDAGRVDVVRETASSLVLDRPDRDEDDADRQQARRRALERATVRGAIVACWADLEDAAAQAGHPRADHETSRELVSRLRALPGVDAGALETLRTLFAEARFSEHDLPEAARDRALSAVERLETDLRAAPGRAERQSAP